jgi:ferredoxin--NADP+ reductase
VATDVTETIPCTLVFRSIGYHGIPIPGVPFDEEWGTIPNEAGRVRGLDGKSLARVYCAGWIKRGPTGVIGTNKKDATETVDLLLEDAASGALVRREDVSAERVDAVLADRGVDVVTYAGWQAIDALERSRGEAQGRPRVKLCSWEELLAAAGGQAG